MASVNAVVNVGISGTLENPMDVNSAIQSLAWGASNAFTTGTGANQAQNVWTDTRTLAASGTEDLDMNGVLLDAFGGTISFTKIKAIIVKADPNNTNDVTFGPKATNGLISPFNAATDRVKVKPGGVVVMVAPDANGYAVTAATADILTVTNGGAGSSVTYTIIVVGV